MENIFQRPPTLMRLMMLTRDTMSLLRAPFGPGCRSKVGQLLNADVGQARENSGQILANRNMKPAAGFHNRHNGCDLRSGLRTANVDPVFLPSATGRIEFSARLLLSSSSGIPRSCLNAPHRPSRSAISW